MAFATKTLRDDNIPTGAGSAGGLSCCAFRSLGR